MPTKTYTLINRTRRQVTIDVVDKRGLAVSTLRIPAQGRACGVTEEVSYSEGVKKLVSKHALRREDDTSTTTKGAGHRRAASPSEGASGASAGASEGGTSKAGGESGSDVTSEPGRRRRFVPPAE